MLEQDKVERLERFSTSFRSIDEGTWQKVGHPQQSIDNLSPGIIYVTYRKSIQSCCMYTHSIEAITRVTINFRSEFFCGRTFMKLN